MPDIPSLVGAGRKRLSREPLRRGAAVLQRIYPLNEVLEGRIRYTARTNVPGMMNFDVDAEHSRVVAFTPSYWVNALKLRQL